jgi:alcohol dehydrogenase
VKALRLVGTRELSLDDLPSTGLPATGQVRVDIAYIALNHLDLYGFRGMAQLARALPLTIGVEACGVVADVGADVADVAPGDRVVIYPALGCDRCRACHRGRSHYCAAPKSIMGFHRDGMAAESVLVDARQVIRVPTGVPLEQAVCTPITMATVQHMLFDNARLERDETILIHAGGSGIGSVAIQMAKAVGATVITTVGNDDKAERARVLGADHVINYNRESFHSITRRLTDKRGVDVVFEHVGEATWERSLLCLANGGRLVTCGSTTGASARTNLLHLVNHQIRIIASFGGLPKNVSESLELLRAGTIEVCIDSVIDVTNMEDALARMERREVFGKIVMRGLSAATL